LEPVTIDDFVQLFQDRFGFFVGQVSAPEKG
jgi:hypothetical protein